MALRYDPKLNRNSNVRYNSPAGIDYEKLRLADPQNFMTPDEYFELSKMITWKCESQILGGVVGFFTQLILLRKPPFRSMHGYTRAITRCAVFGAPIYIAATIFGNQIRQHCETCTERRLKESYENPISKEFVI